MSTLLTAHEAARLTLGVNVIVRPGDLFAGGAATGDVIVAPQDWVALTGPCPTCEGHGQLWHIGTISKGPSAWKPCPDCRDGRRIVPLYTECPTCRESDWSPVKARCLQCGVPGCDKGYVLAGRGSIEVVPVVDHQAPNSIWVAPRSAYLCDSTGKATLRLDSWPHLNLPVPGRDWGIVLDVVEVAS